MGRRKHSALEQRAKNNASRRRRPTPEQEAAARARAEAELLATLAVGTMAAPARYGRADHVEHRAVWARIAPRLRALQRDAAEFVDLFVAYVDTVVRYNRAVETLMRDGDTQVVETVAGGSMIRVHPAEKIRAQSLAEILALSARFGFTPADNLGVMKQHRDLIDRGANPQGALPLEQPRAPSAPPAHDPLGAMDALDGAPTVQ